MADYYTNFSVLVPLKEPEHRTYALALHEQAAAHHRADTQPEEFPPSLQEVIEDWRFEASLEERGLWLHSDSGGIDAVCAFIQHLLQQFQCADYLTLEWSNDCSKPLIDAFGGGAAFITAERIESMNTGHWLQQQIAAHVPPPTNPKGQNQ